jgi:glycosyltransferase involved in cell wall biosynthesis
VYNIPYSGLENLLVKCIDSIINQTYVNIEIVLIDDGSVDNASQICDEYARKDPRVMVVHQENSGVSEAGNVGLKNACGEYILFVDNDDSLALKSCETFQKILNTKMGVDVIVGAVKSILGNRVFTRRFSELFIDGVYSGVEYMKTKLQQRNFLHSTWLFVVKRKLFIDNNLYNKKEYYFNDLYLFPLVLKAAKRVVATNFVHYNYFVRAGSKSTSAAKLDRIDNFLANCRDLENQFSEINDPDFKKLFRGYLINNFFSTIWSCKFFSGRLKGLFKETFPVQSCYTKRDKLHLFLFKIHPQLYGLYTRVYDFLAHLKRKL